MYKQIVLAASVSISAFILASCGEAIPVAQTLCQSATRSLAPRPKIFNVLQSYIDGNEVGVKFELSEGGRIGVSKCIFNDVSDIKELELVQFEMTGFNEEDEPMLFLLAKSNILLEKIKLY